MNQIKARKALYIKLGKGGVFEHDCLEKDQTVRLDYREINHEDCLQANWKEVKKQIGHPHPPTNSRQTNEIRLFYTSDKDTLWVTFYGGRLWWCFSENKIKRLPDGTRIRQVIGKWRDSDVKGNPLNMNRLHGKLKAMQGFQGTICSVEESSYLLDKINGVARKEVKKAEETYNQLIKATEHIIRSLDWKDFEVLIDLIFRQAGWQRLGRIGGAQKTLDLDLISPVASERYGVQVKSKASLKELENYQKRFEDMKGFTRLYFVVHTPSPDLSKDKETESCKLWLPEDIAALSVKYGLVDWVIDKAG